MPFTHGNQLGEIAGADRFLVVVLNIENNLFEPVDLGRIGALRLAVVHGPVLDSDLGEHNE
ncbi:hypothetical protein D3C75_1151030 [compost metagenome]